MAYSTADLQINNKSFFLLTKTWRRTAKPNKMNKLASFSDFALTRGEMKRVTGGYCKIYFDTADGGCSSMVVATNANKSKAVKWANSRIGGSFSGSSKITGYNMTCS